MRPISRLALGLVWRLTGLAKAAIRHLENAAGALIDLGVELETALPLSPSLCRWCVHAGVYAMVAVSSWEQIREVSNE